MSPHDAVRAAMRYAVEVDSEKPILFAAELLITALAAGGLANPEWEEMLGLAGAQPRANLVRPMATEQFA